uniref:Uncharacterized protein n=1 Tax=Alexandrium andersonii TaxID=327968 RepID=A0A7S2AH94_9DINO|mmetsp:Transcript_12203/g.27720  ORF Transcript_12203/g.27720 Transcript_12203/m.27720 type:complete len:168 (+) Transcript_12203:62-565(+)
MALAGRRSASSRGARAGTLLALVATAATLMTRSPSANVAAPGALPPKFALRVCEKCVNRKAGEGYNPLPVLRRTASAAAAAGWPAPEVQSGGCVGACEYGPNVRLVKGDYAIPVAVDGMTEEEADYKVFLSIASESMAERAFGLSSRAIAEAAEKGEASQEETAAAL